MTAAIATSPANWQTPDTTSLPCVAAISGLTLSSARSYASMSTPAAAYDSPSLLTSQILASCGEGGPGTGPPAPRAGTPVVTSNCILSISSCCGTGTG